MRNIKSVFNTRKILLNINKFHVPICKCDIYILHNTVTNYTLTNSLLTYLCLSSDCTGVQHIPSAEHTEQLINWYIC